MAEGQPQDSQGNPLDQPRDRTPTQREETPEAPEKKEGEKQPDPEKREDKPGGDKPESPQQDPLTGENREGQPDERDPGQPVPPSIDAERWGELPARVRETFRNQGHSELPVQYREWIDAYYRRMSRRR